MVTKTTQDASTKQQRVDGTTKADAKAEWMTLAAEHAELAQKWKDARELLDVRLNDLTKADEHKIPREDFEDVARHAAKAARSEKLALVSKQEAKKALDAAWETYRSFYDHEPPEPLLPDNEEGPDEAPAVEATAVTQLRKANEAAEDGRREAAAPKKGLRSKRGA